MLSYSLVVGFDGQGEFADMAGVGKHAVTANARRAVFDMMHITFSLLRRACFVSLEPRLSNKIPDWQVGTQLF